MLEIPTTFCYPKGPCRQILTLYKYVTEAALLGFLKDGSFKLGFGYDSNDPFELYHFDELFRETSKIGFVSLTDKGNDPYMWGNYADKYRGAMLELRLPVCSLPNIPYAMDVAGQLALKSQLFYAQKQLLQHCRRWQGDYESSSYEIAPMRGDVLMKCFYSDVKPTFPMQEPDDMAFCGEKAEYLHKYCAYKHLSWKHECEYRFVYHKGYARTITANGKVLYLVNDLLPLVSKIVLGPYCSLPLSDVYFMLDKGGFVAPEQKIQYGRASYTPNSYLLNLPQEYSLFPEYELRV